MFKNNFPNVNQTSGILDITFARVARVSASYEGVADTMCQL